MHKVVVALEQPEQHAEGRDGVPKFSVGDTAVFFPGLPTIPAAMRAATRYKLYGEDEYGDAIFPPLNKYFDPTRTSTNQEPGQRDHPLMRLANTYLMLAEALMRDGKPDLALPWINKVRERAAKPGQQAAMDFTVAHLDCGGNRLDPRRARSRADRRDDPLVRPRRARASSWSGCRSTIRAVRRTSSRSTCCARSRTPRSCSRPGA